MHRKMRGKGTKNFAYMQIFLLKVNFFLKIVI